MADAPAPAKGKKKLSTTTIVLIAVGALVVGIVGFVLYQRSQSSQSSDTTGTTTTGTDASDEDAAIGTLQDEIADLQSSLADLQSGTSSTSSTGTSTSGSGSSGSSSGSSGSSGSKSGSSGSGTGSAEKKPAMPANVSGTAPSSTTIKLTWGKVSGATSYPWRVTYQEKAVKTGTATDTNVTVTGLDPDHTYTCHIAAANSAGTSSETNGPVVHTPKASGTATTPKTPAKAK